MSILKKIFKRHVHNNIISKTIFGLSFSYVRGKCYKEILMFIDYLRPYMENDPQELVKNLTSKSKKYILSVNTYKQDLKNIQNIVKNINPSVLPKATGLLRQIQLKKLNFAKEITQDLEQNLGIKLFMDDGTLLGAVRHKGFIPWDDDMDFSLMREDYNKLLEDILEHRIFIDTKEWTWKNYENLVSEALERYPNQIIWFKTSTSLKCYKLDGEDKICFDIFALDYYLDEHNVITLNKYVDKINENWHKLDNIHTPFIKFFDFYENVLETSTEITTNSDVIAPGVDNYDFHHYTIKGIRRKSDIFPLQKLEFEDTEFWAPANPHEYLKTIYSFYNRLPVDISIAGHTQQIKKV